jgi:hypothetical protein
MTMDGQGDPAPACGTLTLRAMLSLEPATITGCFYPLLFQQGETAYGNPLVDGQHPHNFFVDRTNELLLGGKPEPAGMGAKLWSAAACCRFPSQPARWLGTVRRMQKSKDWEMCRQVRTPRASSRGGKRQQAAALQSGLRPHRLPWRAERRGGYPRRGFFRSL